MMAAKGVLFKLPPICRYTACSPPCFRLPGFGLNEGASPFRLQPAAKTSAWTSCQVDGRKVSPGTFSPGFCVKWEVEHATWHAFAGIPCQVDSMRCHLTRFGMLWKVLPVEEGAP